LKITLDHEQHRCGELEVVTSPSNRRALVFGHPLWREDYETDIQSQAVAELRSLDPDVQVRLTDPYELRRNPEWLARWVNGYV
jgi:hypothetical protein